MTTTVAPSRPSINKYGARKTLYAGRVYDSAKEAKYAQRLEYLKHAHELKDRVTRIEYQVPYDVYIKTKHIYTYILDFKVYYGDGRIEYVDVKGYKKGSAYSMFRLKKKGVEAYYNIEITEA